MEKILKVWLISGGDMSKLPGKRDFSHSDFYIIRSQLIVLQVSWVMALSSSKDWCSKLFLLYFEDSLTILG